MVDVALQSDLVALAARVTALEQAGPPPGLVPSPTDTFVTAAGQPPIVDDKLNQWRLVAAVTPGQTGLQIETMAHGTTAWVVDPPTQNVVDLGIQLVSQVRTVVQKNAAGGCYYANAPGVWVQFSGPVPP